MWTFLPFSLLASALAFAASTIKNPTSPNAIKLEGVMRVLYNQIIITYPHFKVGG